MKRLLSLLIIAILFASCSVFNNEDKIVNLEGKRQKLDYSKHRIYILFSTLGCHDCHNKLNEYFENNNFYTNDSIEIIGYIGVQNGEIKNLLSRKSSLVYFNKYYPNIKKVYFSEENKDRKISFLDYKSLDYEVPAIFLIKQDTILFLGARDIFKYENGKNYNVNKDLLIWMK